MSTTRILRAGLVASASFATLAALASTASAQSRYGNVYDYESGQNCGQACVPAQPVQAPAPVQASRYGAPTAATTYNPAPVYVDCAQMGTCAPAPAVVYTQPAAPVYQPAPTYSAPTYSAPTYAQAPANCPAGTTAQSDGTCMQTSTYSTDSYTSYSSGSTYTSGSSYGGTVDCPAGTTAQSDGTCMQTSNSTWSGAAVGGVTLPETHNSATSYSYGAASVECPAGTTAQSDGSCMQTGSVEIYTGDASTSYGYTNDGSYGPTDYMPVRK